MHFFGDIYGLSGAAGTYPCLWCLVKKGEIRVPGNRSCTKRTLSQIQTDYKSYKMTGCTKSKAAQNHNVIHEPLMSIPLSHVCIPYLHILLGLQKMHHEFLEVECHQIDEQIAQEYAHTDLNPEPETVFGVYVSKLCRLKQMEKVEKKLQRELLFERKDSELSPEKKRAIKSEIKRELRSLAVKIHSLKQEAVLDTQSGPIVANLEQMLLRNNIVIQAYHSRSFV